ncbi:TadE/TadG family type IV pilus assembly protein [Paenibacillus sp. 1A_MP2]|uniref:TadE/TadG family type IV pilus assembly protein n=1 Tax=Paenibacillus sp. 1A_MP2 TaxID=3457495 RepID=UPI003FCE4564
MKKEEGSFTIEASLVFPIVLFILVLLLFFSMYMYQKTFLNQHAYAASERAAYSWDNSHKQAMTGEVVAGEHDNLYWRLTDDRLLGALFGWAERTMRLLLLYRREKAEAFRKRNCPKRHKACLLG